MVAKAQVRVRLPDGREHVLLPGDIIGRMPRSALHLEEPRISEAHALVSLRGAELKLLSLRGRMSVEGRPLAAITLTPGLRVVLAGFFAMTVVEVTLPKRVFAIVLDLDGHAYGPTVVDGVMALHVDDPPGLVPRFDPTAAAIVWSNDEGVFVRPRDAPDQHLRAGHSLPCDGGLVRVVDVPLSSLDNASTIDQGSFDIPLTIVLHYDAVHVRPATGAPVVFDGQAARLLSEVALLPTPASWLPLARLLWDDEDDEHVLRQRWDQATSRIRRKLRAGRVRADLLRSTGAGLVELYLGPDDRLEDLT